MILTPDRLREGLSARVFGGRIVCLAGVSSTMDAARDLAREGAPEGALVVAESQTGGRGRLGRAWVSPPGGLWMSVLLRPDVAAERLPLLGLVFAVGCAEGLSRAARTVIGVKWPNDLILEGRKLGGLLLETEMAVGRAHLVIAGVGVNVNLEVGDFPSELQTRATSLKLSLGRPLDLAAVARGLLEALEKRYLAWKEGETAELLTRWRELDVAAGRPVRVLGERLTIAGIGRGVDDTGAFLVETGPGRIERIISGELEVL
jgi:BirA family biotin operon repressor/biotin-[acetyl-CoA-carboxylase] ligase